MTTKPQLMPATPTAKPLTGISKYQLMQALFARSGDPANAITLADGHSSVSGYVMAVAKEDGGTSAYIVTLRAITGLGRTIATFTHFVRTID